MIYNLEKSDFFMDEVKPSYQIKIKVGNDILPSEVKVIDCEDEQYQLELEHDGQKYFSKRRHKTDENFEFSLADLHNNLPLNVSLLCCLSCRHGNSCPFGGEKIFCFKAYDTGNIKDKYGTIDIFANIFTKLSENEYYDIVRNDIDICESFEELDEDTYTYNSWLYYIKKK